MEKLKHWMKNRYFWLLVAAGMPLFISAIICIGNGVYPFGENCLLHVDMYHQYCPFFTEFLRKLREGKSLMYSWNIGLGSDFVSVFAYYLASPLNWLLIFCPKGHVIEFMSILMIGKISLAGAACYWYLQEHFSLREEKEVYYKLIACIFSTAYALNGFVSAYSWNLMWMDSIVLAPLIILGLEKLVKEKRVGMYYVTLAISIVSNYYISIMICIFLVFYFVKLWLQQKENSVQACIRFAWYSLLAGGTGAIMMLPEAKILGYSGSAGMSFPKKIEWYFSVLAEIGRGFVTVENYTGAEHWPNLYAGVFAGFLGMLYLFHRGFSWKKKIAYGGMLVFFLCSFANNYLDFIWHGLHFPDSLPGRQSFLFIFVVLVMGYEVIRKWKETKLWQIGVSLVLTLGLCTGAIIFADKEVVDVMSFIITCLFVVGYALLLGLILMTGGANRRMLVQMACVMAVAEVMIHSAITGFYTTSRTSYMRKAEAYEKLLELAEQDAMEEQGVSKENQVFYRVEDTERLTKNDDALYGYHSATQFSSLMNINVSHFFQSVYMEGGKNFYCYNGATPIPSAMLSVKYFVSEEMLTASPLRTLVEAVDGLFLYKNNYCLPIGYVIDDVEDRLDTRTSAKMNGIQRLGYAFGAIEDTLVDADCEVDVKSGETMITFFSDGYFYGETMSCSSDTLTICDAYGKETGYSKTTHKYLFDFGQYKKGDVITIKNRTQEEIYFSVYRLNYNAVNAAYDTLRQRVLDNMEYTDTHVTAHLAEGKAGKLLLAIPLEEGWRLYMDGQKKELEAFADTFITVDVDEKEHEIELIYETPGLKAGAGISCLCVLLFALSMRIRRCLWKRNN